MCAPVWLGVCRLDERREGPTLDSLFVRYPSSFFLLISYLPSLSSQIPDAPPPAQNLQNRQDMVLLDHLVVECGTPTMDTTSFRGRFLSSYPHHRGAVEVGTLRLGVG